MHPAELAKLALVVYLAHWLAKRGSRTTSFTEGLLPFLLILGVVVALVYFEPDLGTSAVIALTGLTMFFVAGGQPRSFRAAGAGGHRRGRCRRDEQAATRWTACRRSSIRGPTRRASATRRCRACWPWEWAALPASGSGRVVQPSTAISLPQAQNDFVFALLGQELGFIGAIIVIGLYLLVAYRGIRIALGAPDTFGALLAVGITAWLVIQAFINIGVVVVLLPITGITLPFISAGGSSLLVSFAAIGILLSISRETLPRGTWNDADSDRGRRHRRPRLPGVGRREVPARASA